MTDFLAEQIINIRKDFPILDQKVSNNTLIYFDNAATTQKPLQVIDAVSNYYKIMNASYQRSSHTLAFETSKMIDTTRQQFLQFIGLDTEKYAVIFTKNSTEAINLVAYGYFHKKINETTLVQRQQQIILVSEAEHHSNLLPWMRICEEQGYQLAKIPVFLSGELDYTWISTFITEHKSNVVFCAITHASNVTGIITDIAQIKRILEQSDSRIPFLVDGAQTAGHIPLSLASISLDFFVCSAHKMYSPAGIGVLVLRKDFIPQIDPLLVGGGMVASVFQNTYEPFDNDQKFYAGTANAEAIAGFSAGITYLKNRGMENINKHELILRNYFASKISIFSQLKHVGHPTNQNKLGIFAFSIPNWHPHDAADFFDNHGIAVRSGFHCAEPLHHAFRSSGTIRVSFSLYNSLQEIDIFIETLNDLLAKTE